MRIGNYATAPSAAGMAAALLTDPAPPGIRVDNVAQDPTGYPEHNIDDRLYQTR